jgi:hypothetical protein
MPNFYVEPSLTPHLNGKLDQGEVAIEVLAPNQYIAAKGPGSRGGLFYGRNCIKNYNF